MISVHSENVTKLRPVPLDTVVIIFFLNNVFKIKTFFFVGARKIGIPEIRD